MSEKLLYKWKIRWHVQHWIFKHNDCLNFHCSRSICVNEKSDGRCRIFQSATMYLLFWRKLLMGYFNSQKVWLWKFHHASKYLKLYLHKKLLLPVTRVLCLVLCLHFCYNLVSIFSVLLSSYFLQLGWVVSACRQTVKCKSTLLCCLRHTWFDPFWSRNKLTGIVRDTQIGGQRVVRGWNVLFLIYLQQWIDQSVTTFLPHAAWAFISPDVVPSMEYHIVSLWTVIYWGEASVTNKTSPTGLGCDCFNIWHMAINWEML
jgi:hypothetical protein